MLEDTYTLIGKELLSKTNHIELRIMVGLAKDGANDNWTDINFTEMAYNLGCSEITIRRAIRGLKSKSLLIQNDEHKYKFTNNYIKTP